MTKNKPFVDAKFLLNQSKSLKTSGKEVAGACGDTVEWWAADRTLIASSLTGVDKADLAGEWSGGWVYITVRANTYIRTGEVAVAFEIRAKDLPRGKFPNSTFEGSLRPAGEDPAETKRSDY